MQMRLQFGDGTIPITPEMLLIARVLRKVLCVQELWVNARDEDFFILRAIENADSAAFPQPARGAPQKVVLELLRARLFEAVDFAAFGVHAGHDVSNRAILARGVHALKDEQHRIATGCIVKLLP
jgi:hypothetical protein